jgi:maltooligosyltrehalose trehalohydrolase
MTARNHLALRRRLSSGVELQPDSSAHIRVWAPACHSVAVVIERPSGQTTNTALGFVTDGYFEGQVASVRAGDRYRFHLDGDRVRPDPVSRFQPEGPHGPSMVVDPESFVWTDSAWPGVGRERQVIYEMHVGTFTPEGTWRAAAGQLEELAKLGVTVIEMMPVADFAGRFGWGYDGVNLYAPTRLYGTPDDLRAFNDRAHALGIGVILDVVYNHLGPDGNYLPDFSPDYFTDRYQNDWGRSLNFEGPPPARDFFVENAAYWIDEFHFDGLRLDATQDIHDASPVHVLQEIVARAREAAGGRRILIVAENEPQHTRLIRRPECGGYGIDAVWNDDFHHSATVALTGRREAYYTDYRGRPQEFISAAKYGYLYQGQWYAWQKQDRGSAGLNFPSSAFITFLQNHDQVANSAFGRRVHELASPGRYRAMTALLLLGPGTPLLFQGQEFAASTPFLYFADHAGALGDGVRSGRREFLSQFPSLTDPAVQSSLPPPGAVETFERCRLNFDDRVSNAEAYRLHRDLLQLRRDDATIAAAGERRVDGAVLSPDAFVLRYFADAGDDRLLVVNLGEDLELTPMPEPLLAPPEGTMWALLWSSDVVAYGGLGSAPLRLSPSWRIAGESVTVLRPEPVVNKAPRDANDVDDRA